MALQTANRLLEDLADELDVPDSRYEAAIRSYTSFGNWLRRDASAFAKTHVQVYSQGSFRLGTPIRPISDEEDYDLDVVCEISFKKERITQEWLHRKLGEEMQAYAEAYGMAEPERSNRVWTLNYADGAQFHMDVLPSVPDGRMMHAVMPGGNHRTAVDTSVAITDEDHPNYKVQSDDWPVSNPNGYAAWFVSRMQVAQQRRLAALRERASVSVAQVPAYKVKTPLQSAVQILKRHRDMRFKDTPELRPRSIILTTLAAHAYQQELGVSEALVSILGRMDRYIETNGTEWRIPNPTNERENFADEWGSNKELKDAFYDWLETARLDFTRAAQEVDPVGFTDILVPRMGRRLVEASMARARLVLGSQRRSLVSRMKTALLEVFDAPHRKPVPWQDPPPGAPTGSVTIASATCTRKGWRPFSFQSDGNALPKGASLSFQAETTVPHPYKVYWQIVNTGQQAIDARGLRGEFEEVFERGHLKRMESTRYAGTHSIECFIVKNGYCAARSGPFVVNIQ